MLKSITQKHKPENIIRFAFLLGIITDFGALFPMSIPFFAKLMWGFDSYSKEYYFAQGYGASLMAGWTWLLVWAYRSPIERRFIALLTIFVVLGLVATEIIAVLVLDVGVLKMIPTWFIQTVLLGLFSLGYVTTDPTYKYRSINQ